MDRDSGKILLLIALFSSTHHAYAQKRVFDNQSPWSCENALSSNCRACCEAMIKEVEWDFDTLTPFKQIILGCGLGQDPHVSACVEIAKLKDAQDAKKKIKAILVATPKVDFKKSKGTLVTSEKGFLLEFGEKTGYGQKKAMHPQLAAPAATKAKPESDKEIIGTAGKVPDLKNEYLGEMSNLDSLGATCQAEVTLAIDAFQPRSIEIRKEIQTVRDSHSYWDSLYHLKDSESYYLKKIERAKVKMARKGNSSSDIELYKSIITDSEGELGRIRDQREKILDSSNKVSPNGIPPETVYDITNDQYLRYKSLLEEQSRLLYETGPIVYPSVIEKMIRKQNEKMEKFSEIIDSDSASKSILSWDNKLNPEWYVSFLIAVAHLVSAREDLKVLKTICNTIDEKLSSAFSAFQSIAHSDSDQQRVAVIHLGEMPRIEPFDQTLLEGTLRLQTEVVKKLEVDYGVAEMPREKINDCYDLKIYFAQIMREKLKILLNQKLFQMATEVVQIREEYNVLKARCEKAEKISNILSKDPDVKSPETIQKLQRAFSSYGF